MAELKDFLKERTVSLSDFVSDVTENPTFSRPSARNFAAHAALMSDEPIDTYDRVMSEMETRGNSPTSREHVEALRQHGLEGGRDYLYGQLASPEVSDEEKQQLATGFTAMHNQMQTAHETLTHEAVAADSAGETLQAENFRINTSERFHEINQERQEIQQMLNEEIIATDMGLGDMVLDMAESIAPFGWNRPTENVGEALTGDDFDYAYILSGEGRKELSQMLRDAPVGTRVDLAKNVIDVINEHSGVLISDENKLAKIELLQVMMEEGGYDETDRWIDNFFGVLDSTVILGPLARVLGVGKAASKAYSATRHIARRNSVKGEPTPVSAANALEQSNPEKYRNLVEVAKANEEAAESSFGVPQVDAIGSTIARQVLQPFDRVKNKIEVPETDVTKLKADMSIVDTASDTGAIYLTQAEKAGVKSRVVHDFRNAQGLIPRPAMFREGEIADGVTGELLDNQVKIKAVYGTTDGGFGRGVDFVTDSSGATREFDALADAVERTKIGLRNYGVRDEDISILVRKGDHYEPVPLSLAKRDEQDFMVQVEFPYTIKADDVDFSPFDVKYNIFDRVGAFAGGKSGSLQRHILDPASMLRPELTLGANRAVDKAARIEQQLKNLGKDFTDVLTELPEHRQGALFEELKRANFKGERVSRERLIADGATQAELKAVDKWETYWDTAYVLENSDLVRTMSNRGYQAIENAATKTKLYGKPVSRNQVGEGGRVYDIDADEFVNLSKDEITALYEDGGTLTQLRSAMDVRGELVGGDVGVRALVKNRPGGAVSRALRENEPVLNYRPGYFSVKYDAPYFVVKQMKTADGKEYEQAIAAAGSIKEAEKLAARMTQNDGGTYRTRGDLKAEQFDDMQWHTVEASGRSSQRVRGERLQDATDVTADINNQYVVGPVDSLLANSKGISNRIAMRDYMEAGKARFVSQFGHLLEKNKFNQPMWPSHANQIGRTGELSTKELADARTTWEYLNYLENGYINAVDDGIKATMRTMAEMMGKGGWTKAEKALHYAGKHGGPTSFMRNAAFNLYLALNPLRQIIIQSHQSVQLAAIAPKYAATRLSSDMAVLMAARLNKGAKGLDKGLLKMSGRSKEEVADMLEAFDKSGLSAAIDRQNLVRGSLSHFVDDINYRGAAKSGLAKVGRAGGKALNLSRQAGFDMGEEVNMMTAFLTFYEKARAANKGKKLNSAQLDEAVARARDYTYNMNAAGDMPYNQNWLGMVFQFMQVPHKAITQMTTNRNLTTAEKARLATFNTVMYGVPPASLMYPHLEPHLPKEGELREAILYGLESYTLNTMLSMMTGEDVDLYYGGLQAVDQATMFEMVTNLATMNIGELLANSPSGSLLFGHNPRIAEFGRSVLKLTNFIEEDAAYDTNFISTIEQGLSLSSGFSNTFKARAALKLGQKASAKGDISDYTVSWPEAMGSLFGFSTQDEMAKYYLSTEVYEAQEAFYDDVKEHYNLSKKQLTRLGKDSTDLKVIQDQLNWMNVAFEDSTKFKEEWLKLMRRDMLAGDYTIPNQMLKYGVDGIMDKQKFQTLVRSMPESEGKVMLIQLLDDMDNINKRGEE